MEMRVLKTSTIISIGFVLIYAKLLTVLTPMLLVTSVLLLMLPTLLSVKLDITIRLTQNTAYTLASFAAFVAIGLVFATMAIEPYQVKFNLAWWTFYTVPLLLLGPVVTYVSSELQKA